MQTHLEPFFPCLMLYRQKACLWTSAQDVVCSATSSSSNSHGLGCSHRFPISLSRLPWAGGNESTNELRPCAAAATAAWFATCILAVCFCLLHARPLQLSLTFFEIQ